MLEKCRDAKERWGGVSQIIDHWLEQRQSLIKSYIKLPESEIGDKLNEHLNNFCADLIDYISLGHFEVYEQLLIEGSAFDAENVYKVQGILNHIQQSTDYSLDFNDAHHGFVNPSLGQLRDFANHLSKLGEMLEDRFELEDNMIAILHTAHATEIELI